MEAPYTYSLHPLPEPAPHITERLPRWSRLFIPLAQTVRHVKTLRVEVAAQQLIRKPFIVEAIEIKALESIDFSITVRKKIIIMFFLLEGNVIFTTENRCVTAEVQDNQFFLTQNQPGAYYASYKCGQHTCLMVTISKKWIRKATNGSTNLTADIKRFLADDFFSVTMPILRIDRLAHKLMRELYTRVKRNIAALDGLLRLYMAYLLEHYNTLLESRHEQLAFKVKQYIDQNYTEEFLDIPFLANRFNVTRRTLQNQFRQTFNTTIHRYYQNLRLQLADELLNSGKNIKDIYTAVGYRDIRSLRYAYAQYCTQNRTSKTEEKKGKKKE